jgi:hypothetical protein
VSNTTTKSTSLVENDPNGSDSLPNQILKPLEYPERVAELEKLCRTAHAAQSPVQPLSFPNDLILAGKMGGMNTQQKRVLGPVQIAVFNRLHPAWQGSPGNFDG